ncbi:MAG: hypothetical protein SFV15_19435 [Polyangiaceae bacterium]|nr:hypothetical protein [Polyangiaceae bacterium]
MHRSSLGSRDGFMAAVELLDRAVHELRLLPPQVLVLYYVGAGPMALLCAYNWVKLSTNSWGEQPLALSALGLALGFVWMKAWQLRFVERLRQLERDPKTSWSTRAAKLAQAMLLFPVGLFAQAVCLLLVFPSAWSSAFFQHALTNIDGSRGLREVVRRSSRQSSHFPLENHFLWGLLGAFAFILYFNILTLILLLPQLGFIFTGEKLLEFSSPLQVLNSTVGCVVALVVFLCLDPVVKVAFVLRSERWAAERDGRDLRAVLAAVESRKAASRTQGNWQAGALAAVPPGVVELNRSLDEALEHSEFGWRIPRQGAPKLGRPDWLQSVFDAIGDAFHAVVRVIGKLLKALFELDNDPKARAEGGMRAPWQMEDTVVALTALVLIALLAFLVVRLTQLKPKVATPIASGSNVKLPDVADESTDPAALEASGWQKMAEDLLRQGQPRLAVRALYLAGVSGLNAAGLVTASGTKSVLDYRIELGRRSLTHAEVGPVFGQIAAQFERVWYGEHTATAQTVAELCERTERLMHHAQG